jgi:GNAT superfamily N-acetyltransferase
MIGVIEVILIKKLTPDLIVDYIAFHERLDFHHAPEWRGCYCHFYHTKENIFPWTKDVIEKHRLDVIRSIEDRVMTGFLAYDDTQVIGWLNANDLSTYHRINHEFTKLSKGKKIALSICFIVDPVYRNKGIARLLLDHAIKYYQSQGYDGMLALPSTKSVTSERHYHGSMNMYIERGYTEIESRDDVAVMYRQFK